MKLFLRTIRPEQHIEDFESKDIPPALIDPETHMVLNALMAERKSTGKLRNAILDRIEHEHLTADNDGQLDAEYARLDQSYKDTNRTMHQVFSDSTYIIHENNFAGYCKSHLKSLPACTGFALQKIRMQIEQQD
jgi:hypothetical protein